MPHSIFSSVPSFNPSIKASISGRSLSSHESMPLKTSPVETPNAGLARTICFLMPCRSAVIFSPVSSHKAHLYRVLCTRTRKGMSAPSCSPILHSCHVLRSIFQSLFNAVITAAAFELPPPRPAATGILFIIRISSLPRTFAFWAISCAARYARFLSSVGRYGFPAQRTIPKSSPVLSCHLMLISSESPIFCITVSSM